MNRVAHCNSLLSIVIIIAYLLLQSPGTLCTLPITTDIDLKKASKTFAQHFSCGSSVTGEDEIVIQGDVSDDVIDFILDKWPQVSPHNVMY